MNGQKKHNKKVAKIGSIVKKVRTNITYRLVIDNEF